MCCLMEPFGGGLRASGLTCSPSLWTAPIVRHINKIYMGLKWKKNTHTHTAVKVEYQVSRECVWGPRVKGSLNRTLCSLSTIKLSPPPPLIFCRLSRRKVKNNIVCTENLINCHENRTCAISANGAGCSMFHQTKPDPKKKKTKPKPKTQTQSQNPDRITRLWSVQWAKMAKNG